MSTINAIAVEAYKKYILVSLIRHGQVSLLINLTWLNEGVKSKFCFYIIFMNFFIPKINKKVKNSVLFI